MATTTERGLGWEHQKAAARLRREMQDGDPCPRCGKPMHRWQKLDAGHSLDRAIYGPDVLPDRMEHARCNRRAGGQLGGRSRRRRSAEPARRPFSVDARLL